MPSTPFRNLRTRGTRLYHILPPGIREVVNRAFKIVLLVLAVYVVGGLLLMIPVYRGVENRFTLAVEKLYPYPAMSVNSTVVSLKRYRAEVQARKTYAATHGLTSTDAETRQFVRDQLVHHVLYAQALDEAGIVITEGDVDKKLEEIYEQVGGKDKLAKFLQQNYGDSTDLAMFRTWIKESLDESAVKEQLLVHASVRHILVSVPEGSDDKTVAAALEQAKEVKGRITTPDLFGDIAKQYSDDIASRDKGGELGTTPRGDTEPVFSADFEQAVFSQELHTISDPIRSKYGWHLVLVESRAGSIDKSGKQLLEQLKQEGKIRIWVKEG